MNNYAPRERIPVEDEDLQRRLLNQRYVETARPRVESRPLPSTAEAPVRHWPLGIVLLTFGILWWLPAARTTVDGWVLIVNTVGSLFSIPDTLPRLMGWPLFWTAIAVGLIYSRVETHELPVQRKHGRLVSGGLMTWIGWLFLATTDIGSTFLGIMTPPVGAWPIHVQLATNPALTFAIALVSTFAPDWVIIAGLELLGVFRWLRRLWQR
jgi:hypothetical protein